MSTPAEPAPTPTAAAPAATPEVAPKSAAVISPAPATPVPAAKTAADVKAESKAASEKSLLDQASEEAKKASSKPEDTAAVPETPVVPEKYEFKAPEGMELDSAMIALFEPVAKDLKLTNDQAQKLADVYAQRMKDLQEAQSQQLAAERQAEVAETTRALGSRFKEEMALAAKARDYFFSPETVARIEKSGLGNNLGFIRDCIKIGKLLKEDTLEEGEVRQEPADARKMYPSMTQP